MLCYIHSERAKFAQLRETFTQLQKSHQHFEKEVAKRKERETELLALTEKLSSSNAELQVERSEWETKVRQSRILCVQLCDWWCSLLMFGLGTRWPNDPQGAAYMGLLVFD